MQIGIIFLDYQRHDYTPRAMQNIHNSGMPDAQTFVIERKGIAAAINEGLEKTRNKDAVAILSNDIIMPDNWLKHMVNALTHIPESGMIGIHCVEGLPDKQTINGIDLHLKKRIFGNTLIPRIAIDAVGYFNEDYDPYGMQDSDYSFRLYKTGFLNYYLAGLKSEHIGHDVGNATEYRKMKDEGLQSCDEKWLRWTKHYDETGNYFIEKPGLVSE